MTELFKKIEPGATPRKLIVVYGPPACGKTRFTTALGESFGKVAYLALDEGSEDLDSVLPQHRSRLEVFKPNFCTDPEANPVLESNLSVMTTDWKNMGFDTLIDDTFSNRVRKWLWHITQKGEFQEKRNMIGEPGQKGSVALPDKGHYGGVQGVIRNYLNLLFVSNPHLNIILNCHEYMNDKSGQMKGGPATAGSAMLSEFPSNFKTIIRLEVEPGKAEIVAGKVVPGKDRYIAHMAPHGIWMARRNKITAADPPFTMGEDPIDFWTQFDMISKGDK